MAHPLIWPKKKFFYPIGNTPACCLTQDVPPEQPANILLLGCGDPRNILYTIYASGTDATIWPRTLDFTCCDNEPAVLARNALLYTLLADDLPMDQVWSIFYDFMLKQASINILVAQCRKLVKFSVDVETWNARYGFFLRVCTAHSLERLRCHWSLYAESCDMAPAKQDSLRARFLRGMKAVAQKDQHVLSVARSAGVYVHAAMLPTSTHFRHLWTTGVHSMARKDINGAVLVNPTFAYSASGETFNVHYGTSGLAGFHLASAFASKNPPSPQDLAELAKFQFQDWCKAFKSIVQSHPSKIVIRLFVGDALNLCRAFHGCLSGQSPSTPLCTGPWSAMKIDLDGGDYCPGPRDCAQYAPIAFDVVDTSNLMDHLGLFNLLMVVQPILSRGPWTTLYTESMLANGSEALSAFKDEVAGDLTTMSVLIDLTPSSFVSGFTTTSNRHEITLHHSFRHNAQFHERIAWKITSLSDSRASELNKGNPPSCLAFVPQQLAQFLFGVYLKLFGDEDHSAKMRQISSISFHMLLRSGNVHHIRATFAFFLKMVKKRVEKDTNWTLVMEHLIDLIESDKTLMMGMNNFQDLCCQLHLLNVYSVETLTALFINFRLGPPRGRFVGWKNVPPAVCVTLVVPHRSLKALEDRGDQAGTPILQREVRGVTSHAVFSSLSVAFGTITATTSEAEPSLIFEEDSAGWSGTTPLIVSFWMPSWILSVEPESTDIALALRASPTSVALTNVLGMELILFRGDLRDKTAVHVSRTRPNVPDELERVRAVSHEVSQGDAVSITMDPTCRTVATFSSRVDVVEAKERSVLESGAAVTSEQVSPCGVKIFIQAYNHAVVFPFPVDGSRLKLRVARKSHFVEIVVPASGPFSPGGFNIDPFPLLFRGKIPTTWNLHRLRLDRLPVLDVSKSARLSDTLKPHLALMLSDRERAIVDDQNKVNPNGLPALLELRRSLQVMFAESTGVTRGRRRNVFGLDEPTQGGGYTLIFVTDVRMDLAAHTFVLDAYILPLTEARMPSVGQLMPQLIKDGISQITTKEHEMHAWKRLLPACVERCRRTWVHKPDCAYLVTGKVPLSLKHGENPLCECGEGEDTASFRSVRTWAPLAPLVTRVALSPLFSASYLEPVAAELKNLAEEAHALAERSGGVAVPLAEGRGCALCGGGGDPRLLSCSRCKKVKYCSGACQRADWKRHKSSCH
ncbi:hypothetical protein BV25DRAFT_1878026 [Artomyces pyxidatus]|uniref:Uncharacterized protein n=1 Tax=Artomyces pyxidatus TaxID=48021 RepID=A0ACB8TEZ2_9AGAM|nr:hypothetical protein BV25DRAFT_1878026 [Artomyces pyxidatus]